MAQQEQLTSGKEQLPAALHFINDPLTWCQQRHEASKLLTPRASLKDTFDYLITTLFSISQHAIGDAKQLFLFIC